MKVLLFILSLILAFTGVHYNNKSVASSHADSLQIGDTLYYLDFITEAEFLKAGTPDYQEEIDTGIVKVLNDSILILTNDKLIVFRDIKSGETDLAYYKFEAMIPSPGYVHITGVHWEASSDTYVNLLNGSLTSFWDNPVLSPDKHKVLAYSCDIDELYMQNGIQLYTIDSETVTPIFEKLIHIWCPYEVRWESDSAIVIKRMFIDNDMNRSYDYVRMKLY